MKPQATKMTAEERERQLLVEARASQDKVRPIELAATLLMLITAAVALYYTQI